MTIKLSLCIEMVFGEYPFLERIDKAAQAEVKAIEFWGWEGKELVPINEKRGNYGLELAAFTGSKTPLTDCHRTEQAVEDITRSLEAAGDLGARNVIITVGQQQQDTTLKRQKENIIKVLKKVAPKAEKRNINLVVEPLNTAVDHKGYFLSSSAEGYDIIDTVGSESVKLLFDIYHQQITEGNIIANIREHINYIGHFHLADVPGRHEPGTGELNFVNIFSAISELDYEGYVGCEFKPTGSSMEAVKNTLQMIE